MPSRRCHRDGIGHRIVSLTGCTRPMIAAALPLNRAAKPPGRNRTDHRTAFADGRVEDLLHHALHQGVRQREAMARTVIAHSWVMWMEGKVITVLSNGPARADPSALTRSARRNRAVPSEGAHRSRSNTDVLAARPTTRRTGASRVMFFVIADRTDTTVAQPGSGTAAFRRTRFVDATARLQVDAPVLTSRARM